MEDIAKFIAGFGRFKETYYAGNQDIITPLKTRQNPGTLIIGCCDSRVDPAILFGCDPGELFVVRNVANLVPPFEQGGGYHGVSAALEFGVLTLEVKHIIVLGHARCGGINALVKRAGGMATAGFISDWMRIASSALEEVEREMPGGDPDEIAQACEQASILVSLGNLMSFPWIRARVEAGFLHLHGWYFDIEAGRLYGYSREKGGFERVA